LPEGLTRLRGSAASWLTGVTALRFLKKRQVRELTTLSFTQIDRLEADRKFPKRTRLGKYRNSRVVWIEEEISEWMKERIAEREPLG
jgi:predicted DNA-binding transcriptional regulator AlpA